MGSTLAMVTSQAEQHKQSLPKYRKRHGLDCTGILRTSHAGYGLMVHGLLILTGIQENPTAYTSAVEKCGLPRTSGDGMISHVHRVVNTFAKPVVGKRTSSQASIFKIAMVYISN